MPQHRRGRRRQSRLRAARSTSGFRAASLCPETESNCRHEDFQSQSRGARPRWSRGKRRPNRVHGHNAQHRRTRGQFPEHGGTLDRVLPCAEHAAACTFLGSRVLLASHAPRACVDASGPSIRSLRNPCSALVGSAQRRTVTASPRARSPYHRFELVGECCQPREILLEGEVFRKPVVRFRVSARSTRDATRSVCNPGDHSGTRRRRTA